MRYFRGGLVLVVAAVLVGCGAPERDAIEVRVDGPEVHRFAGRWYTSDGVLHIDIPPASESTVTAATVYQRAGARYRPTGLTATPEGLLVKLTTPDGPKETLLAEISFKSDSDTGGAEMVIVGNSWFLFKNPSRFWRIRGAIDAKTHSAGEAAGGLINAFSTG